jgi:hypothetical protein
LALNFDLPPGNSAGNTPRKRSAPPQTGKIPLFLFFAFYGLLVFSNSGGRHCPQKILLLEYTEEKTNSGEKKVKFG